MKKLLTSLLALTLAAGMLVGCGKSSDDTASTTDDKSYTIGISQFAEHGALDNTRKGFLDALADEGIVEGENLTVEFENAQADTAVATQIAQNFVTQNVDLIYAIATPSAQSAFNASSKSGIPVVFGAITDPISAELAKADGSPAGEVTGVSDALPIESQLKMIREILPEAKTVGILYTTSEANSEAAIKDYEALVDQYGFKLELVGVNTIADIPGAADALLSKVDCLATLTDNTIVSAMPTILDKAFDAGVPVFGSEVEQVKIGCIAGEGIDYYALGQQAGKMAAKILKGEAKASEMPFEALAETSLYLNDAAIKKLGIEIPQSARDRAAEVFTEIQAD